MSLNNEEISGIKDQFIIKLAPGYRRPITYINNMTVLIDTGAEIPVLSLSEEDVINDFNGKCILGRSKFGGFGGDCWGKVYEIEKIELGKLIYPNMKIFVPEIKLEGIQLVVSATMLYGLDYDINTKNHTMTVTVPQDEQFIRNVSIESKDGKLVVLLNGERADDEHILSLANATANLTQINTV